MKFRRDAPGCSSAPPQLFRYLIWALPLLAMSTATAIVLVAMA